MCITSEISKLQKDIDSKKVQLEFLADMQEDYNSFFPICHKLIQLRELLINRHKIDCEKLQELRKINKTK